MPSAFTHAAAACAIGVCFNEPEMTPAVWTAGVVGAVLPDIDAVGYWLGVPYHSFFGHRGFTHSLTFAALYAVTAAYLLARRNRNAVSPKVWLFLFVAAASHGILDAFTNGGGGIALLSPFTTTRYFSPFRPIRVAPISITRFFTHRGALVFASELLWVWLPASIIVATVLLWRRWGPRLKPERTRPGLGGRDYW